MKRIFMVSRYALFGDAVEGLLGEHSDLKVVGRESDVDRAIQSIRELRPDIVILDNDDPNGELSPVVARILGERLATWVIGLNLQDNTICTYRGEQKRVKGVEDLVQAIESQDDASESISAEEWAELAKNRSQIYGFLASVYNRKPDQQFVLDLLSEDFAGFLRSLIDDDQLPQTMREGLDTIERFVCQHQGIAAEELSTQLGVERTRLLRGVKLGYGPPPPYESLYMGSGERPILEAISAVRQAYAEEGVGLPEGAGEQPDFIGVELDFMRYLTEQEMRASTKEITQQTVEILEKEESFLEGHIHLWVPHFCEMMEKEAHMGFYQGIAEMTKGFVLDELPRVVALIEVARNPRTY